MAKSDPGCCGIRLYVEKENFKAQDTYKSLGMKNAGYEIMEFTTR
jgi:ribosomal protein S18 acetylase RimI-like enzyme